MADSVERDSFMFLGIATCITVLAIGILIVYGLRLLRLHFIPESLVFLSLGCSVGLALEFGLSSRLTAIVDILDDSFSEIFFTILLPPVVLYAGYQLDIRQFIRTSGAAGLLAFGGTLISAAVIGVLVYLAGLAGAVYPFSFLHAALLGAALSATDTVAVISSLERLRADTTLHSLLFGESVLNDAVAIVLFRTLLGYEHEPVTPLSVLKGCGMFFLVLIGSFAVGFALAAATALLLRYARFREAHAGLEVEKALLVCAPFAAYMLSEGLQLSGVIAILAAGAGFAYTAKRTASPGSRRFTRHLYRLLANLCEALSFVYVGIAMTQLGAPAMKKHWPLCLLLPAFCLAGRAAAVWPCAAIINRFKAPADRITKPMRFVLFYSGLRGGVAFALASAAASAGIDKEAGEAMPLSALFVVLLSMVLIGGTIDAVVRRSGLSGAQQLPHAQLQGQAQAGGNGEEEEEGEEEEADSEEESPASEVEGLEQGRRTHAAEATHMLLQSPAPPAHKSGAADSGSSDAGGSGSSSAASASPPAASAASHNPYSGGGSGASSSSSTSGSVPQAGSGRLWGHLATRSSSGSSSSSVGGGGGGGGGDDGSASESSTSRLLAGDGIDTTTLMPIRGSSSGGVNSSSATGAGVGGGLLGGFSKQQRKMAGFLSRGNSNSNNSGSSSGIVSGGSSSGGLLRPPVAPLADRMARLIAPPPAGNAAAGPAASIPLVSSSASTRRASSSTSGGAGNAHAPRVPSFLSRTRLGSFSGSFSSGSGSGSGDASAAAAAAAATTGFPPAPASHDLHNEAGASV